MTALEAAAERWIAGYFNERHLVRTRDWVVELDASADEALLVAALTHDIERREPGGPVLDPRRQRWDDAGYLRAHSERSAQMVEGWLQAAGASPRLCSEVSDLIRHHEIGGFPAADRLQAADSLSFLEVNAPRARGWVEQGRCTPAQARAKLDWMLDRIALPQATARAESLHARALAILLSS